MNHDLKPYPAYKNSGVPWLGQVPTHWEVRRLRDSTEGCITGIWGNEPNGPNDLPCVRVADFDRQRLRVRLTQPTVRSIAMNERRRRMLVRGDLLLEKSGGGDQQPVGVVMLYDHDIPAVCSNFVARLPVSAAFSSGYLAYLHSHLYEIRLNLRSIKQTTGIQNLDSSAYLSELAAFPPPREQSAIARFLDDADQRIRRYIRTKKKLIALLNEQKQAIIHRAVARGLDPNVRLKPSGVEWLGDVPEHWEVRRVKRLARSGVKTFTDGDWIEIPYITAQGVRLIQTGNVGIGEYREKGFRYVSEETFYALRCTEVEAGDVLICRLDGPVGRACLAPDLGNKMITSVDNVIMKVADGVDSRYMVYVMSSPDWLNWIASICRAGGGFRYRISRSMLGNITIPLPPTPEQRAIADYIQHELDDAAVATSRIRAEIDLLHEYRTRLIADVVTGKLDVREAAARLPDEVEEAEPLDESEAMGEDEAEGEGVDLDALSEEAIA